MGSLAQSPKRVNGSLHGVRVGGMSSSQAGGVLRWFAHLSGGVECRGVHFTLLGLQALQKWQLDFFGLSVSSVPNLPHCSSMQLFLVPYNFVCCCSRRCLSRCQHCSKGSQVQPVSGGLFSCALCHVTSPSFPMGTSSWWLWSWHTLFYVHANGQV